MNLDSNLSLVFSKREPEDTYSRLQRDPQAKRLDKDFVVYKSSMLHCYVRNDGLGIGEIPKELVELLGLEECFRKRLSTKLTIV